MSLPQIALVAPHAGTGGRPELQLGARTNSNSTKAVAPTRRTTLPLPP